MRGKDMIEEIHKGCGGTIISGYLACYPPIPFKKCSKCGMTKQGEREKIIKKEIELKI